MSDPSSPHPAQKPERTQASQGSGTSPQSLPTNVKVYDRPERKGLSPALLLAMLIILVVLAVFVYRALVH